MKKNHNTPSLVPQFTGKAKVTNNYLNENVANTDIQAHGNHVKILLSIS